MGQVEESEAIDGSYGAGPDSLEERYRDPDTFFPRDAEASSLGSEIGENSSAYMLVYVRECDLPKTMLDLSGTKDNVRLACAPLSFYIFCLCRFVCDFFSVFSFSDCSDSDCFSERTGQSCV